MTPTSRMSIACILAVLAVLPARVTAQDGQQQQWARFRVLVPDLEALEDADRDFGEDVAKELRELFASMQTHEAIDRDEIKDFLDDLDLDMRDLTCTLTRQLALQMDAQVALCATYVEPTRKAFAIDAIFYDIASGEAFTVSATEGTDKDEAQVASHIFGEFDRYTQHLSAVANCADYAASRQWDRALENCDRALDLNPDAIGARYRRARILFDAERPTESLEELERVLEAEPAHEEALRLAGYVAGGLGLRDRALEYYSTYLMFSPGNASVRMRVAYDLAEAGDPEGALLLIREGLDVDPDNLDLWEQLGGYAFTIGEALNRAYARSNGDGGGVAPDAVRYFRDAIDAYETVRDGRGEETAVRHLISIVVAYVRLGDLSEAVLTASDALAIHDGEPRLWSIYADALRGTERLDLALEALERVAELDPGYQNLGLRRGLWLLEAERPEDAVEVLRALARGFPDQADAAARILIGDTYERGVQSENYGYAITWFGVAKDFDNLPQHTVQQVNFWLGYAMVQGAALEQESRTLEVARATLPKFQAARELLRDVGDYPGTVGVNIRQLLDGVQTYIEIQEAIIRRGG